MGKSEFLGQLRLLAPLFGLLTGVWALRWILHLAGAPSMLVHLCSVTVASALAILLAALLIHTRGVGSYRNVIGAAFFLTLWGQALVALAIGLAALTHHPNIYTAGEYTGGLDPLRHVLGHLTFGVGTGTLLGAAMGSLLLWMLRRQWPPSGKQSSLPRK